MHRMNGKDNQLRLQLNLHTKKYESYEMIQPECPIAHIGLGRAEAVRLQNL